MYGFLSVPLQGQNKKLLAMDKKTYKAMQEIKNSVSELSSKIEAHIVELLRPYLGKDVKFNNPVFVASHWTFPKEGLFSQEARLFESIRLIVEPGWRELTVKSGNSDTFFSTLNLGAQLDVYYELLGSIINKGSRLSTEKKEEEL